MYLHLVRANNHNQHYHPHELYDATNPLWREEHHYTGERKGPETIDMRNRFARNTNLSFQGENRDEEEHEEIDLLDHLLWHHRHFRRGGGGRDAANDDDDHKNFPRRRTTSSDIRQVSSTSTVPTSGTQMRRRKNAFIQFKRRAGRFNIDFFSTPPSRPPPSTPSEKMTNEAAPDETAPVSVPSNDDANSTAVVEAPTSVAPSKTVPFHGDLQQLPAVRNVEMALSVDPFGLATLLQTVFLAAVKLTSATFASLQLIAPMILAKRCLQALGYIFYDHYNGRYIRNVYTKRMQHMQEFEVIASARALGRFMIQLSAMTLVGNVVAWAVLKGPQEQQSWLIPCLLQPSWVCYWWSGLLWMGLVCLTGSGVGMAMAKDGFTVKVGNIAAKHDTTNNNTAACTKFYRNPLSIRPTVMGTPATNLRKWRRNAGESPLDKIMLIPWQLLQWMKDPEESINSMFRMANYKSNYPIRASLGPKAKTIKLDTLLFPSTWRPLRIYSCLVVVQAIFETLSAPFRASDSWKSSRILRLKMMKAFLIHETTHNEWYRVFVKERRVALGAIISMIELLVLLRMMLVATWVDKLASLALIPVLIAQVVTWYMNTILYFDHYLPTARSVPAKRKKQIALV